MTSISAQMMSSISEYRNANGKDWHKKIGTKDHNNTPKSWKILTAEAGYIFTFAFSITETVAKSALLLLSTLAALITTEPMKKAWEDVKSSGFSIGWSFVDICITPFCLDIATSEDQARNIFSKGNLLRVPSPQVN
ncbi:MAG: hypothetical protein VX777_03410 [Chlamydiota bacterium]|nr:hypothetical protein [Chlamydiota bacterium]